MVCYKNEGKDNVIKLKQVVLSALVLSGVFLLLNQSALAEAKQPTIKLSPKIKIQDRDERWFARLPCNQLHNVKPNSTKEEALLAQRKKQCVKGLSVFY